MKSAENTNVVYPSFRLRTQFKSQWVGWVEFHLFSLEKKTCLLL